MYFLHCLSHFFCGASSCIVPPGDLHLPTHTYYLVDRWQDFKCHCHCQTYQINYFKSYIMKYCTYIIIYISLPPLSANIRLWYFLGFSSTCLYCVVCLVHPLCNTYILQSCNYVNTVVGPLPLLADLFSPTPKLNWMKEYAH